MDGNLDRGPRDIREDFPNVGHLPSRNHGYALPKGQAHAAVNDEVLPTKQDSVDEVLLLALPKDVLQVAIEFGDDSRSKAEGVDCSDAGKDALGVAAGLGLDLENVGFDLCIRDRHGANDEQKGRNDADQDECQLPLADKSDDEGGHKSGNALDDDAKLFRDARLDEFAVGGCLHGDRPGDTTVEVCDFLAEGGFEVGTSEISSRVVGDVGQEGGVDVCSRKSDNSNVDKVEPGEVTTYVSDIWSSEEGMPNMLDSV